MKNELDSEKVVCICLRKGADGRVRLSVLPKTVHVRTREGECVRWMSPEKDASLHIAFDKENPFLEPIVHGGQQALSSMAREKKGTHKYKYSVKLVLARRTWTVDPDVEVEG
jgi:hypothetical protein